ncbi:MAG: RNA polymerase sigma factor [Armatimonadota bacterium]
MEALTELIECFRMRLFALAYSELHNYDDAQDAVASAILKMCLHINNLKQPASIHAWMQCIVRNESRMMLRQPNQNCIALDQDEISSIADKSEMPILSLDIRMAIKRLPYEQSRAIALFYLAGLPIQEIANRLKRPAGTIKRWLYQGRLNLIKEMEDYRPMNKQMTASIIQTDMSKDLQDKLTGYLYDAGFDRIDIITDIDNVSKLIQAGVNDTKELHIPDMLVGSKMIIFDEWLGGRSSFELFNILKVSMESEGKGFCMLAASPSESTLFAAWAAGLDLFFDSIKVDDSFKSCMKKWIDLQNSNKS